MPDAADGRSASRHEIDKALRTLVDSLQSEKTDFQLRDLAQPVLAVHAKVRRRTRILRLLKYVFIISVIASIFLFDPTYRFVCIFGRLAAKRFIVPQWDFTEHYNVDCIIENPYYVDDDDSDDLVDCEVSKEVCEVGVTRASNLDPEVVADWYLKAGRPVVVSDAMGNWPAMGEEKKLDLKGIVKAFEENAVLNETVPCSFETTRKKAKTIEDVCTMALDEESIFSCWENCEPKAVRAVRSWYKRPYFLPGMAEIAYKSWFIIGNNGSLFHFLVPSFDGDAMWIAVTSGELGVTVYSHDICSAFCQSAKVTLTAGEILIYPTKMWWVTLRHESKGEVVAVASSVSWENH